MRGEKNVWAIDGKNWRYQTESLQIIVHHWLGLPREDWFVSCYSIGVDTRELTAKKPEDAKFEAMKVVRSHLQKLLAEVAP